ncbi:glycosyltransferase family 4 protein [Methylosinus sp. Ce-a6]|uniref:glycosyltransferase family 4 protein n=1 Tax=Methylosinus sp. Ce-a6 TaxID=2172005 RepID=UPI00135B1163|nr:glycosyltransferase [Methylosinus sp. Ce-a6]
MATEFRVPRSKFRLFPCAVDPVCADEAKAPGPPTVLTVTRIGPGDREKNVDKALRAFALLSSQMPQAIYEIVGDGVLRGELEALARELGIAERVRFLGRVDDAGLRDAYRRASVFILPSSKEGFGIVYLEAWQWALPVICSTEGASCEIVSDGVDGFVVDPDNIDSLAEHMHFLLANPEVARTFGERGRRKVEENYLDGVFGERLKSLLNELQETDAGAVDNDAARRL